MRTLYPMRPHIVAAFAIALTGTAHADDRFARFLDANPPVEGLVCGYTTTATSSLYPGETRVERYSLDDGWRLVSVNGEPPSDKALADYADDAEARDAQRQRPVGLDFAAMVRGDTVRVAEEDADTIVFAFIPDSAEGGRERAMMEEMVGRLTVAKADMRPLEFVIELDAPTSPMPTVKMTAFRQEMAFTVEPTTGAALTASMRFAMRGKAFVFRKLDSEADIRISDYDCRLEAETE